MEPVFLSFSEKGQQLAQKLAQAAGGRADRCRQPLSLKEWTKEQFQKADAIVYVGALGIAVRAIAPFVASKTEDPAVVVVDELGLHVIPVLSGHLGGANDLARQLAAVCGGEAVITTATDINGRFAVDEWAKRQNCRVDNPAWIKRISGRILAGGTAVVYSPFPIAGTPPAYVACVRQDADKTPEKTAAAAVSLSVFGRQTQALRLVPRIAVLGIGCRKGTPRAVLEEQFAQFAEAQDLIPSAIVRAASIDLKAGEPGLLEFCGAHGWPLQTYTAEELAGAPGEYTASEFVSRITGVDNVCERSAVLASAGGRLVIRKQAGSGVTFALALQEYHPDWTWQGSCGTEAPGKPRSETADDKERTEPDGR